MWDNTRQGSIALQYGLNANLLGLVWGVVWCDEGDHDNDEGEEVVVDAIVEGFESPILQVDQPVEEAKLRGTTSDGLSYL